MNEGKEGKGREGKERVLCVSLHVGLHDSKVGSSAAIYVLRTVRM